MSSFSIIGDYVAADFLPAAESSIEAQLSFSEITKRLLQNTQEPERDAEEIRTLVQAFLTWPADYLIIDLQDSDMLAEPGEDAKDALRLGRDRWEDAIRLIAQELRAVYRPEQIIVNEHFSATMYLDGKIFKMFDNSARINRYNMLMRFLFSQLEKELQGCHIIPFPADVFEVNAVYNDESELQYHPCYYHYGQQAMDAILGDAARTQTEEENRIAIAHDRCSETMSSFLDDPGRAAEMDFAERRMIRGLRLTERDSQWLQLAWTENIYAPAYLVERYEGGTWEKVETISAEQAPACWISDLEPDTEYYFRVTAEVDDAARRYSQELICRTSGA